MLQIKNIQKKLYVYLKIYPFWNCSDFFYYFFLFKTKVFTIFFWNKETKQREALEEYNFTVSNTKNGVRLDQSFNGKKNKKDKNNEKMFSEKDVKS